MRKICVTGIRKTSIANNFGYVKDSVLMFAGSIRFLATPDRTMQLPSLSRGWMWPRLLNRDENDTLNRRKSGSIQERTAKMTQTTCFNAVCVILPCKQLSFKFSNIFRKYFSLAIGLFDKQ